MMTRRSALVVFLSASLLLATAVGATPSLAQEAPLLTFVSVPDLWNQDIGDVTGAPGWDIGDPNSINASYEVARAKVLNEIASQQPRFVLVAGDLVEGEWHEDADNVGIFGTITDRTSKAAAIQTAASIYYPQWRQQMAQRGLEVHAAVGDHEIGDNPWPVGSDKTALVNTFKSSWANYFTRTATGYRYSDRPVGTRYESTAYALRRGNVVVVTVDVFSQRNGTVYAEVINGQLDWLKRVLSKARADSRVEYIIVQGHTPVLGPVRTKSSSAMSLRGGASSAFWKLLQSYKVDLYLCGEVHDMTATNRGGVEQVAHGGILGWADRINYMVGRVYRDRMELELRSAPVTGGTRERLLWQTTAHRPVAERLVGDYSTAGTMTITSAGAELNRTGYFLPYVP